MNEEPETMQPARLRQEVRAAAEQTVVMLAPEEMEPDVLREVTRQTAEQASKVWLWLARAYRRISDERLYAKWGGEVRRRAKDKLTGQWREWYEDVERFESFEEYIHSDMHNIDRALQTAKHYMNALKYIQSTEPKVPPEEVRIDRVAVQALAQLRSKVVAGSKARAKLIEAGLPESALPTVADWRDLHEKAFSGTPGNQIRKACAALGKGIRTTEENDPVQAICNRILEAREAILSIPGTRVDNMVHLNERVLMDAMQGLLDGIHRTVGADAFESLVRKVRAQRKPIPTKRRLTDDREDD